MRVRICTSHEPSSAQISGFRTAMPLTTDRSLTPWLSKHFSASTIASQTPATRFDYGFTTGFYSLCLFRHRIYQFDLYFENRNKPSLKDAISHRELRLYVEENACPREFGLETEYMEKFCPPGYWQGDCKKCWESKVVNSGE